MENGTFIDIVSIKYKDIRISFNNWSKNRQLVFDEDSFNDAFIKCADHFKDTIITYNDAIKYFWTAYIHTVMNNKKHNSFSTELSESIDVIDSNYNEDIDKLYNIIIKDIQQKFGDDAVQLIHNHFIHNTKDKQLSRKICKYIKTKYKGIVIETLYK